MPTSPCEDVKKKKKKKKGTSPCARSMAALRKLGYTVAVVERWNAYVKIRQDLFGFIDLVAIHPDQKGVLGIQATSQTNVSKRVKKCLESPHFKTWIRAGNGFCVDGWVKKGAKGKRQLWEVSQRWLNLSDLSSPSTEAQQP